MRSLNIEEKIKRENKHILFEEYQQSTPLFYHLLFMIIIMIYKIVKTM